MRNTADVIVHVDLERALAAGLQFFLSANGVVLSPGDERGFISPEFFSRVEDRKGHPLPGWIPKPSEPSVASVSETAAPKPLAAEEKKKIKEAVTAS
jgi:2'-phosphotransferase